MLMLIGGLIVAYFVYILIAKKDDKPSTDLALAHAALREIVERAMEEARKLPKLDESVDGTHLREGRAIADHSYEDFLATAILNKVIDKFQRERVDNNSNVLHDTDSSEAKCTIIESEHNYKKEGDYISHHIESNDDCNEIKHNANHCESFMMEEQIEEVTTIDTSDNDELSDNNDLEFQCTRRIPFPEFGMDIIEVIPENDMRKSPSLSSLSSSSSLDSSDLNCNKYSSIKKRRHVTGTMDVVSPIESWEDNWLFQKRKTSWLQSNAVDMLVPSSDICYKALIGDKNAEDTSDLSECSSVRSDAEIEKELMEAINNEVSSMLEYNADSNQEIPNTIAAQFEKDEVDNCVEANMSIINDVIVCEDFNETDNKKHLEVFKEKTIKHKDNKEEQNECSSAFITLRKGANKVKRDNEDIIESNKRITAMEDSIQKDMNIQVRVEKDERNNREEKNTFPDEDEEQRDSEYTEHYDTAIQRHLDSLTKIDVCTGESIAINETKHMMNEQFKKLDNCQRMTNFSEEQRSEYSKEKVQLSYAEISNKHVDVKTTENDKLSTPPRPGTIAEREHKKWENAPPIENNPYSEENIRKRCLEKQYSKNLNIPGGHYELTKLNEANLETLLAADRPDIKRFGRDYYINQSKASGERHEKNKSAMLSRPSSSLSQRSSCTGDEQCDQQEEKQEKQSS